MRANLTRPVSQRLTIVATLLSMIAPFSMSTYMPSFPDIEMEFGITRAVLSQSIAVYLLAFAFSTLIWGPLSDRYGRRRVVLISMALYTLGSVGCALAVGTESFLLLRILQGLTASGGVVAARAMIRDGHSAEAARRAMSQLMLYFAMAPAIAPILGGLLHDLFGWRSVFWFLGAFGGLLVLMGFFTTETLENEHRQSIRPGAVMRTYINAMRHKRYPVLISSWALSFAGMFIYIAGAPTIIYDFLGLGSDNFGWLFLPIVIGTMLGAFISNHLTQRLSAQRTVSVGFAAMMLASVTSIIVANSTEASIPAVIAPLLLYVTGFALMLPTLSVLTLDCLPTHRGTASSMQSFLQMMTGAGVASFVVPLLDSRWLHFALGQAVFILLAAGLWYRLQHNPLNKTEMD